MSSIQVSIHFDSPEQAIEGLARLRGVVGTTAVPAAGKSAATAAGAASSPPASPAAPTPSPSASATPATTPAPKPAPSPKPAATPAPASAADQPTYATSGIPELIQTAQKAGKVPEIKALLAEFGVAKGPELKSEQLGAFKARMEALNGVEENLG